MSTTAPSAGSTPGLRTLLELPPASTSPTRARRHVQRVLEGCPERIVDIAAVVVTELAANATEHARTEMWISVDIDDDRVRIEVGDGSPDLPVARRPRSATSGRGLLIVDRLADEWGVDPSARGKTVWVELKPPASYEGRSSATRKNAPRPATSRTRRIWSRRP